MRTTVNLDDDVAAVRRLQEKSGIGVSEAVNRLALTVKPTRARFRQRSVRLGLSVDVSNTAEALEVLDGPAGR